MVISGTVLEWGSRIPVSNSMVSALNGENTAVISTTTDNGGYFSFEVPDTTKYLSVSHIGYNSERVRTGKGVIYLVNPSYAAPETKMSKQMKTFLISAGIIFAVVVGGDAVIRLNRKKYGR